MLSPATRAVIDMSKLYACITSETARVDRDKLISIARQFSYSIETLEDGILFDVAGLERLIGDADQIAQNILEHLKNNDVPGNVAVAKTIDTAMLLARQKKGLDHMVATPAEFPKLPLRDLDIENDSLGIFKRPRHSQHRGPAANTKRRPDKPLTAASFTACSTLSSKNTPAF
jgi:hypothetical protein